MKDFEEYKKNNTSYDWVIRDLIISIQTLRKQVIVLSIGIGIVGIVGVIF